MWRLGNKKYSYNASSARITRKNYFRRRPRGERRIENAQPIFSSSAATHQIRSIEPIQFQGLGSRGLNYHLIMSENLPEKKFIQRLVFW
jgi:hypothetical protein